jgi:hypothetical protein
MGPVSVLVNNAGINRRTPFTGDPANVIRRSPTDDQITTLGVGIIAHLVEHWAR